MVRETFSAEALLPSFLLRLLLVSVIRASEVSESAPPTRIISLTEETFGFRGEVNKIENTFRISRRRLHVLAIGSKQISHCNSNTTLQIKLKNGSLLVHIFTTSKTLYSDFA
jgi:hypothetical protein